MTNGIFRACSNECHVTPAFKFHSASPDPKAAINTEPSATVIQINIIGVYYMLIGRKILSSILHP